MKSTRTKSRIVKKGPRRRKPSPQADRTDEDSSSSVLVPTESDKDSSSEYDTDLDETEEKHVERQTQKQQADEEADYGTGSVTYTDICKHLKVIPIRRITEQLPLNRMFLQNVPMNTEQGKALACALWHNTCLESLDLEDNGLCGEDIVPIINAFKTNIFITSLSLCDNELQVVGAIALEEVLRETTCLSHLNLSGTKLGDHEMEYIAAGIHGNRTLRWLDLSHNRICNKGSKKLGRALGDSRVLQVLNLSWNHIRLEGAVGILKGLQINTSLINVDLSMNGLGFEGSLQLEDTLRDNTSIRYLDISNNRINWEGVTFVAKGLKKNYTLQMLKIGTNPINMEGCYELLKAVAHKRSKVLHIGFENIPVNGAVLTVTTDIQKMRQFSIKHGGILDTRDVVGIRKEKPEDPITLVVRYLATIGIRIIDLFRMFDQNNDGHVTVSEFVRGLKRVGVPLSERDMTSVATRIANRKGHISYEALANGVRNHIREERKEDKRQEVKKRNRLEERRRILQTQLPEIYRRTLEENLFLLYGTQSCTNLSSPSQSLTTSMISLFGHHPLTLPVIESGRASMVSSDSFSGENQASGIYDQSTDDISGTESNLRDNAEEPRRARAVSLKTVVEKHFLLPKKRHSMSAISSGTSQSHRLLNYMNAYLERKKTQAEFDLKLLPKINI